MLNKGIMNRCSVRNYLLQGVQTKQIERILCAGMQAPSALNRRPWIFIVVNDSETKCKLACMSPYSKPAADAAAVIVNCADLNVADPDGEGKQWWIQDLAACTQNELIQISTEELGGVWLGCYPKEDRITHVSSCLSLPENIIPFSLVAVGYPAHTYPIVNRCDKSLIFWNKYVD